MSSTELFLNQGEGIMPEKRITNLPPEELEDFFLLMPRIFCDYRDPRRGPYELAYIYANTPDNEDSMFLRAIQLEQDNLVRQLATSEGELGHGYAGFQHSVDRLIQLGWNKERSVIKFDVGGNVNTGSEAVLLAQYALRVDGDLAVIAPPLHIVRAFMTTLSALDRAKAYHVRVYPIVGLSLPWGEQAAHSQGATNTRAGWLEAELMRLEKYRAPEFGSMIKPAQALKYLDWRDR